MNTVCVQMKIGTHMREVMEITEHGRIGFTGHDDSQKMDKKAKVLPLLKTS
jgi:hypothetical protein